MGGGGRPGGGRRPGGRRPGGRRRGLAAQGARTPRGRAPPARTAAGDAGAGPAARRAARVQKGGGQAARQGRSRETSRRGSDFDPHRPRRFQGEVVGPPRRVRRLSRAYSRRSRKSGKLEEPHTQQGGARSGRRRAGRKPRQRTGARWGPRSGACEPPEALGDGLFSCAPRPPGREQPQRESSQGSELPGAPRRRCQARACGEGARRAGSHTGEECRARPPPVPEDPGCHIWQRSPKALDALIIFLFRARRHRGKRRSAHVSRPGRPRGAGLASGRAREKGGWARGSVGCAPSLEPGRFQRRCSGSETGP